MPKQKQTKNQMRFTKLRRMLGHFYIMAALWLAVLLMVGFGLRPLFNGDTLSVGIGAFLFVALLAGAVGSTVFYTQDLNDELDD